MTEPTSPEGFVKFDHSQKISVPLPEQDTMIAIRRFDWARIRGRVEGLSSKSIGLSGWYTCLFGIGTSSGFSIIPISATKDLPSWVMPMYCMATFSFLLLGVILWLLDRKLKTNAHDEVKAIVSDMATVESLFEKPE